jgi:UDP-glucose 4-epimerase
MSQALVTGGSGFLGSHIADTLTARGWDVTILDRQHSPHLRAGQTMVVGDILDERALTAAAAGCEAVFHLAGLADLNRASTRPIDTATANLVGTLNVLEAARKAGVKRFVFASTVYVYSRAGGFYRCSKQACEEYIDEYRRQFGLDYTILRFGSLYGPRADGANGVYRLLLHAARGERIRHIGTPGDTREYVHVEDAARLSVDALAPEHANQHLVITGHHPMTLEQLFTMFSEIVGRKLDIEYVEPPEGLFDAHYRVTPYAFNPRVGRKLTSSCYVDMGQGLLQMLEQLHGEGRIGGAQGERA